MPAFPVHTAIEPFGRGSAGDPVVHHHPCVSVACIQILSVPCAADFTTCPIHASPFVVHQQMAFKLVSLQGGCCKNNPFGENTDIISHLAAFVDAKDFLFFASVCKRWKNAWGERPTHTMALTPATSVSQLSYSFECGLGRTTAVCDTCIAMGRLDLLRCAMANNCPWLGDVCRLAAETGDLETLQWARTRNYPWGPETCALLAKGGHLSALKWCRQHGCPWDKETLQEAEWGDQDDVVEWAVANGCPDWSDGED